MEVGSTNDPTIFKKYLFANTHRARRKNLVRADTGQSHFADPRRHYCFTPIKECNIQVMHFSNRYIITRSMPAWVDAAIA